MGNWAKIFKAFRELHVDLLLQNTIEVGIGDVQGVDLHVFKASKGKDGPDSRVRGPVPDMDESSKRLTPER